MIWKLHRDKRHEKNSTEKLEGKGEHSWKTYLYFHSHLLLHSENNCSIFKSLLFFWRLVVFRNISQRVDSISGMLSMTLVWNQRTSLENEGGGEKAQGGGTSAERQSTSWGRGDVTRVPPLKGQTNFWQSATYLEIHKLVLDWNLLCDMLCDNIPLTVNLDN